MRGWIVYEVEGRPALKRALILLAAVAFDTMLLWMWWVLAAAAVLAPLIQIGLGALVRRFHRTETPANGVTVG